MEQPYENNLMEYPYGNNHMEITFRFNLMEKPYGNLIQTYEHPDLTLVNNQNLDYLIFT